MTPDEIRKEMQAHADSMKDIKYKRPAQTRTCLSYWFPILEKAGLPVPKTKIIETDVDLLELLENGKPAGFDDFMVEMHAAAIEMGYPIFLRTGQTSGKHDWKHTCYVESSSVLAQHVLNLTEFSAMADFFGLDYSVWVIREFLELEHYFTAFEGMPVAREFRCFIKDGECICKHPYWPPDSIKNPSEDNWQEWMMFLNGLGSTTEHKLNQILSKAAPLFDGAWSIDLAHLRTGGFVITDMAEADRSFHWPGCPNEPEHFRLERNRATSKQNLLSGETPWDTNT